MPQNEDFLDSLELDIVQRLQGDSWFGQARLKEDLTYVQIPVIAEDIGNIDIEIAKQTFLGDPGIAIIVQALEWDIQYQNAPGPYIEKINVMLLGIENVPFNRGTAGAPSPNGSLKTIKSTMIRAQELLHLWVPPTLTRALVCTRASLVRVGTENDGDAGILQYNAPVIAAGGVAIIPPQVAQPVITPPLSATLDLQLDLSPLSTVIVTTAAPHGFPIADATFYVPNPTPVVIAGAAHSYLNGTFFITGATDATHFTYSVHQSGTDEIFDSGTVGGIKLTCSTPGATICYSWDRSLPSPRNGIIYTGPFPVQAGKLLYVNAWLSYYQTSILATRQF